ncbi:MAG: GNAT family N-acetyltransferase [Pseudomonadota bacterium]
MQVRDFRPGDEAAFRDLNVAWIERYFGIEDEDIAQLEHVEDTVFSKGGRILLAELDGQVVGTVALIPKDSNCVELAKMSAREDLRGQGIGKALMNAAVAAAHDMKAKSIWIETNDQLQAALGLYRAAGFEELDAEAWHPTPYNRCNLQFMKQL